ncbi:MAG: tol-pal system protein YbgF [Gemmatimonadaceae bacterium]|nr:tol-pal system protein YbgF [Gemmatimonadaceae bacterium]
MTAARLLCLTLGSAAVSACVASKQDVLLLQTDLKAMRAEYAYRDSTRRVQFDSVIRTMVILNDSLRGLKGEIASFQGNVLGDLFKVRDGLIEIRSLTGQSQSRITELRAELEQRNSQSAPATVPPTTTPPTSPSTAPVTSPAATPTTSVKPADSSTSPAMSAPATGAPGPNQLYTMALDQLRRGSTSAARAGFTDFLAQYPQHERAGDAQYYIAETLERDTKALDAEAAYLSVYTRFPRSEKAPTAMFKRSALLRTQGKADKAREVLDLLVKTYPRSDEADLARERLRSTSP